MTFRSFQAKTKWLGLGSAAILLTMDEYCRLECYNWRTGIDITPRSPMLVWLLLIFVTLLLGFISIPRWPSFVSLFVLALIVFQTLGIDWPTSTGWFN